MVTVEFTPLNCCVETTLNPVDLLTQSLNVLTSKSSSVKLTLKVHISPQPPSPLETAVGLFNSGFVSIQNA